MADTETVNKGRDWRSSGGYRAGDEPSFGELYGEILARWVFKHKLALRSAY